MQSHSHSGYGFCIPHYIYSVENNLVNRLTMFVLVRNGDATISDSCKPFQRSICVILIVPMQLPYVKSLSARQCQHICVPSRTPCGPDAPLEIALLLPKSLGQPNAYLSAPAPN